MYDWLLTVPIRRGWRPGRWSSAHRIFPKCYKCDWNLDSSHFRWAGKHWRYCSADFFFFNNLGGADHYSVRFDTKNVGIFFHVPEFRKSIFTNLRLFIFHLYWLFCPWKFVSSSLISFPRCINMFHLLVFVLSEVTELISLFLKILNYSGQNLTHKHQLKVY